MTGGCSGGVHSPVQGSPHHGPHLRHRVDLIHLSEVDKRRQSTSRTRCLYTPTTNVCVVSPYLKLGQLLHQLLLLLGVAQRGDDVEEDLQQVQTLSGHVGQSEDGRDAARKNTQLAVTRQKQMQ